MKKRRLAVTLALGLFAMGLGLAGALWLRQPPPIEDAIYYAQGRNLPAFELTQHNGQPWSNAQLQGLWTLAFIGYASCPDICPTTLAELARWYETLGADELADLQVAFISVDPERDQPELLAEYIRYFHPDFIAATGGHDQLVPLTRAMGLLYSRSETGSALGYTVDHSARIALIDPSGELRGLFNAQPPAGLDPLLLSADLQAIRQRW